MNVVATLEVRYLPLLNQAATRLGEKHPTFKVNIGSGSIGGATTFHGHDMYVEAFRPDKANHEPNCLALEICVRDLPGTPTLCTLSVGWGGDGIPPNSGRNDLQAEEVLRR